jgi:hypothetical protein
MPQLVAAQRRELDRPNCFHTGGLCDLSAHGTFQRLSRSGASSRRRACNLSRCGEASKGKLKASYKHTGRLILNSSEQKGSSSGSEQKEHQAVSPSTRQAAESGRKNLASKKERPSTTHKQAASRKQKAAQKATSRSD